MNTKGFANVILIALVVLFIGAAGTVGYLTLKEKFSDPTLNTTPSSLTVPLGYNFTLNKGQTAKIGNTGLEVTITGFINSGCPAGAECFWSGQGIEFEYRFNGETLSGMDLVQAFGFEVTVVESDYETYASLIVEKMLWNEETDNCGLDNVSSFTSVDLQELGEGPDGSINMGFWSLTFENGTFSWMHSDYGENGTYSCDNGIIQAQISYGGEMTPVRLITAAYDEISGILTWEGVDYANIK